jgi:ribosomal protein S27AE
MVVAVLIAVLTTALLILDLPPETWKGLSERWILPLVALGFSLTAIVVMLAIAGARRSWTGFQGKTVWDFLQLLIVPLMLVAIGLVFSLQQDARQQRVEDQRADAERELAEKRAQDEALQAYLNQMSQLMLDRKPLEAEPDDPVHAVQESVTRLEPPLFDPPKPAVTEPGDENWMFDSRREYMEQLRHYKTPEEWQKILAAIHSRHKVCPECGTSFVAKHRVRARYCCMECRVRAHRAAQRARRRKAS